LPRDYGPFPEGGGPNALEVDRKGGTMSPKNENLPNRGGEEKKDGTNPFQKGNQNHKRGGGHLMQKTCTETFSGGDLQGFTGHHQWGGESNNGKWRKGEVGNNYNKQRRGRRMFTTRKLSRPNRKGGEKGGKRNREPGKERPATGKNQGKFFWLTKGGGE